MKIWQNQRNKMIKNNDFNVSLWKICVHDRIVICVISQISSWEFQGYFVFQDGIYIRVYVCGGEVDNRKKYVSKSTEIKKTKKKTKTKIKNNSNNKNI